MKAQLCPVCEGEGKVSKYRCVTEKSGVTQCGTAREQCPGCEGKGWVLVPEGNWEPGQGYSPVSEFKGAEV